MEKSAREVFAATKSDIPVLRGVHGTYAFEIEQVGRWFVAVNDGATHIEESNREADCTIHCSEPDFIDIVEGRRNLITAGMQGRVQIRGDVALAQKFHGLVSSSLDGKRGAA